MTLEIKLIPSWLVCCRVVHDHNMLRLGIQGLMLQGNCCLLFVLVQIPILPTESKCMPHGGMEGVCRVVIGCTQPDGWKITSANLNGEWFLSGGGSFRVGVV